MQSTLTVGSIVTQDTRAAAILSQFGIDCKENLLEPIETICLEIGLELVQVFSALLVLDTESDHSTSRSNLHLFTMLSFLEREQQRLSGQDLREADRMLLRACDHAGALSPPLGRTARLYYDLQWDLMPHLITEQCILFPQIRQKLASASPSSKADDLADMCDAVRVGRAEHQFLSCRVTQVEASLRQVDFTTLAVPHARHLAELLRDICARVRRHIQLEDHLLFPSVLKELSFDSTTLETL